VSRRTSTAATMAGADAGPGAAVAGVSGRAVAVGITAPILFLPSRRALRLVERNMLVYRRGWIFIVSGFFEPFFYLLSLGVGLNKLVGPLYIGTQLVHYTAFVAPGLLATSAMNGAVFDSTFNVFFKLKIAKTYDALLSTPLGVGDVAVGEITWALMRGSIYAAAFIVVMAALGLVLSPWTVLCFPAAMLTSFAFAATGMAATSYMRSWQDFDMVSLAILPLFLFSATFYPLTVYPGWLQLVVRCTPLYQSVSLVRSLDAGTFSWALAGHAAYLITLGLCGLAVTARRLGKLLLP
jgi:lipooligosaccharide transport system permease protein